jgi:hypothetical protein
MLTNESIRSFAAEVGMRISPLQSLEEAHQAFTLEISQAAEKAKASVSFTAALMRWLPWASLLAAQLLGLHPLEWLFKSALGLALLAVSAGLTVASFVVTNRMMASALAVSPDPGIWLDAFAQAVVDGVGFTRALQAVRAHGDWTATFQSQLSDAFLAGGPLAQSLHSLASKARGSSLHEKRIELTKLPTKLLLPALAFQMPQFLLLLVAPMVMSSLVRL